jgi:hypothetical protein
MDIFDTSFTGTIKAEGPQKLQGDGTVRGKTVQWVTEETAEL